MHDQGFSRRDFLGNSGAAVTGLALGSLTAVTSARAAGANERLAVGIVGPGGRGSRLLQTFFDAHKEGKAELTAVCDLWTRNREKSASTVKEASGQQPRQYRRLHLIHGDSNVLPATAFLKVGTTRLMLDLLDADELPQIILSDAVTTLRTLSRNLTPPWHVVLADGKSADAVELLFIYQQKAKKLFEGRDGETDALLESWEEVLDGLSGKPQSLVGVLDWVTKEYLLREFCRSEKLEWGHPWLESQDLEFHHIDPDQSLGLALARRDGFWEPKALKEAMLEPPKDSRAHARSRLMREIQGKESSYFLDWEAVEVPNQKRTRLLNPFQP